MKILIFILCVFPLSGLAEDIFKIEYPLNFPGVLLKEPDISKIKSTSFIVNKYIQENYSLGNQFSCGGVYMITPDQELKSAYENGMVKMITEFGYTNNVKSYTPIRQLVENPDKQAVFNGYYFISR